MHKCVHVCAHVCWWVLGEGSDECPLSSEGQLKLVVDPKLPPGSVGAIHWPASLTTRVENGVILPGLGRERQRKVRRSG